MNILIHTNILFKDASVAVSEVNTEYVTGSWKKGDPYYKVAELCSTVGQKGDSGSHELEYLAQEISKQSVEGTAWFLLGSYSKIQQERDKLKKNLRAKGNNN